MAEKAIRRPQKALNARFVDTVTEPGKHFDGNGLFLRVQPNGAKQWVQRITIRGKRCELGLGSPPTVSLATARGLALENRGKAMLGRDPLQEKRDALGMLTFAEAVERYLASKLDEFRSAKHRAQWRNTLDSYANPLLGPKLVSEIRVQDVLRVLEPIWADKTETASRLRGRIESVLSWSTVAGQPDGTASQDAPLFRYVRRSGRPENQGAVVRVAYTVGAVAARFGLRLHRNNEPSGNKKVPNLRSACDVVAAASAKLRLVPSSYSGVRDCLERSTISEAILEEGSLRGRADRKLANKLATTDEG